MSLISNFPLIAVLTFQKLPRAKSEGEVYTGGDWPRHVVELTVETPEGLKIFKIPSWGEKK